MMGALVGSVVFNLLPFLFHALLASPVAVTVIVVLDQLKTP